jgi:hypothetical protein
MVRCLSSALPELLACVLIGGDMHRYQNMNQLLASLTGIDITQITNEFMELCLLQSHTLRLFFDPQSTKLSRVEVCVFEEGP